MFILFPFVARNFDIDKGEAMLRNVSMTLYFNKCSLVIIFRYVKLCVHVKAFVTYTCIYPK